MFPLCWPYVCENTTGLRKSTKPGTLGNGGSPHRHDADSQARRNRAIDCGIQIAPMRKPAPTSRTSMPASRSLKPATIPAERGPMSTRAVVLAPRGGCVFARSARQWAKDDQGTCSDRHRGEGPRYLRQGASGGHGYADDPCAASAMETRPSRRRREGEGRANLGR